MSTYYIFYNNSIFSLKTQEADSDQHSVYRLNIDYADGYIEGRISNTSINKDQSDLRVGAFYVKPIIYGRIWHKYGFGEKWEIVLEIRDTNDSKASYDKIIFNYGAYTNDFNCRSIAYSIIRAFNEIHRFESVQDYKDFQIIKDDTKHDLEDEIVNLSKVILLCKKYEGINPVFPYKDKLRGWIEKRINYIFHILQQKESK